MTGWKALPILLKILFVVLLLWAMMSIAVIITMPEREIAFFGLLLKGISGNAIVLLLDVIAPLVLVYSMLKRLHWGATFGMLYNGVFILNNIVALFMFRDIFGNGIYFPLIASIIFFTIIFKERKYFAYN